MKKIFTKFLALIGIMLIGGVGSAWAGDTYTLTLDDGVTQSTANYFTVNTGGGFNAKYTGTYDGKSYSKGLKMNSSSSISFSTTAKSTIIVVQSTSSNAANQFKLDGTAVANSSGVENATNTVKVYTITDVAIGSHSITQDKETGILFVSVEYTGSSVTVLEKPSISDNGSGNVTITGGSNVKYTVDGSNPTTSQTATAYKGSFSVEDGTIVNAASVGDGTTTASSDVVSKTILVAGVTVAAPTITAINGTVKISCETIGATIKYSTDGISYNNYTGAFTLTSDATVYAKAVRENCTDSEVSSLLVTTVSKGEANASVTLYYDGNKLSKPEYSTLTYGDWKLELLNSGKDWTQGALDNATVAVDGEALAAIKVSNGAQNRIVVPEGFKVTRLAFYSVVNGTPASNVLWGEVNGTRYTNATQIPMENTNGSNPDVRVFGLDEAEGNITFTNAGVQVCFAVVIDYIDANALAESDLALSSTTVNVNVNNSASVTFTSTSTGNVSVSSDKTSIATASIEGNTITITGVADGTATITVSQEADETYAAGSKTITVTVVDPYAPSVVYAWNTVGTTTLAGTAATGEVRVKNVNTAGIKFGNGLSADNYLKIESNNGGFKVGDVVAWTGCINNSAAEKQGGIMIVSDAADGNVQLACSELFNNTYVTSVSASTGSFTLTEDAECLYIGRATSGLSGATATWLTSLSVSRPASVSVEITAAGYATFSAPVAVDLDHITGGVAYVATEATNDAITIEPATGIVPANTGLIIKGAKGTCTIPVSAEAGTRPETNYLVAVTVDNTEVSGAGKYVLGVDGGVVKFLQCNENAATLNAGKAYLATAAPVGANLRIVVGGEETGISNVTVATAVAPAKLVKNGQIVIVKNGQMFNAAGAQVK